MVGLFVASGMTVMVASFIWLGMSNFFKEGQRFAVYFDESVQGLDVEAPVKYRGVSIGRVGRIKVAADSRLIEVVLEMEPGIKFTDKIFAQLKIVGITGNMFIELDHIKEGTMASSPELKFPTEYPVIPTRPSDIKQLFNRVDDIVTKLTVIDMEGFVTSFQKTLNHMDQMIIDADIKSLSKQIKLTLAKADQTLGNEQIPEIIERLKALLIKIDQTVEAMELAKLSRETSATMKTVRQETESLRQAAQPLLEDSSRTVQNAKQGIANINKQTNLVSQDITKAIKKLNSLLDNINDQPSQLIFGSAPPRRSPPAAEAAANKSSAER